MNSNAPHDQPITNTEHGQFLENLETLGQFWARYDSGEADQSPPPHHRAAGCDYDRPRRAGHRGAPRKCS